MLPEALRQRRATTCASQYGESVTGLRHAAIALAAALAGLSFATAAQDALPRTSAVLAPASAAAAELERSGFGFLWNTAYLARAGLPVPRTIAELAQPVYHGHLVMASPSESRAVNRAIEALLQRHGWVEGWRLILLIAANSTELTARGAGIVDGVLHGVHGAGLGADAADLPSAIPAYPVGIAAGTADPSDAPFDPELAQARRSFVNALFDAAVSARHRDLVRAARAIIEAEAVLSAGADRKAALLLADARATAFSPPVSEARATDREYLARFSRVYEAARAARQRTGIEEYWSAAARRRYEHALAAATQAAAAGTPAGAP